MVQKYLENNKFSNLFSSKKWGKSGQPDLSRLKTSVRNVLYDGYLNIVASSIYWPQPLVALTIHIVATFSIAILASNI